MAQFLPRRARGQRARFTVVVIGILLVALIGWLDALSGWATSFSIFYLIPIIGVTWRVNRGFGFLLCVLSTVAWWLADRATNPLPLHAAIPAWNALMRLAMFLLVSGILDALQRALATQERAALTDHLTGLDNARAFFSRAQAQLELARRENQPLTLAFVDLDDFKAVNERLGHLGADELLRNWAHALRRGLRDGDGLARLGGDEFALLFGNTSDEQAKGVLKRLESELALLRPSLAMPVTYSMGAVTFQTPPNSVDEMLHVADELMYRAKASGKDRWLHEQLP